ncbi:MAG: hypothetical protein ALECFALPRED_010231 [Alectoria fallacina]|uniref:DUF7918 domain-containing protein n=1 Tax=Alectoria fallacina TaxID=1903189 RepID=A0A8H3EXS6_9LECA|nr:MAG: hypothetical protein ALECFALPRED_010231 [Alectoria fallacina]
MHPFRGLSVEVTTQSGPLILHHDPDDDPSNEPCTRQRYIEAVTGATFKVKVSVHKNFDLSTLEYDDAVHIVIFYDGQKRGWYTDLTRATIVHERSKGKPAEHTFSHVSNFCQETQQWKLGATSFGALDMKDTFDFHTSLSDVQNLGRIQVKVARVHRILRLTPIRATKGIQKPVTEVTEKILKGKAIANTVRVIDELPGSEPPPTQYDHRPIYGEHGQPLIFNIFYRSRHTLQTLGCIPRTPSPEPEIATPISAVTSREQKVRDLRAQLALLEGAGNVKSESSGSSSRATVKREPEDTENAGFRKRSRHSGPIETIDLTGD